MTCDYVWNAIPWSFRGWQFCLSSQKSACLSSSACPPPDPSTLWTDPRPPGSWSTVTTRPPVGCYEEGAMSTTREQSQHSINPTNTLKFNSPWSPWSEWLPAPFVDELTDLLHRMQEESKESHESLRSWICLRITGTPSAEVFLWTASPLVRSIFNWISLSWRAASKAYIRNRCQISKLDAYYTWCIFSLPRNAKNCVV